MIYIVISRKRNGRFNSLQERFLFFFKPFFFFFSFKSPLLYAKYLLFIQSWQVHTETQQY